MQKLFAIAIILVIVLFAAGCSKLKITDMPLKEQEETGVTEDINAADEDSTDLSSETAENLDEDLEDFAW